MALFLRLFTNTPGSVGRVGMRATTEIVNRNISIDDRSFLLKLQANYTDSLLFGSLLGTMGSIGLATVCIKFGDIGVYTGFGVGFSLTIRHIILHRKIRNLAEITYEKEYKKSGKAYDLLIELMEEAKNAEKEKNRLI